MQNSQKLSEWIAQARITRASVADDLGVTRGIITRWCNGTRRPNRSAAIRIQYVTRGHVKAADWGYIDEDVSQGAAFLQTHLLSSGRSVATLAAEWGISPTGLRAVIAGRSKPSERMLKELSAHVGLKLEASDFNKAA